MTARETVFRLGFDVNTFQCLYVDSPDKVDRHAVYLDGSPRAQTWNPPPVYVAEPNLQQPDIWYLSGCSALVLSSRARDALEDVLVGSGEFLPLPHVDMELWVFNVTAVIDCVDQERSDWVVPGALPRVLEFHPHRLPATALFKIPETARVWVYALEDSEELDRSFRWTVAEDFLSGLIFEEIWTSHGGGQPIGAVP